MRIYQKTQQVEVMCNNLSLLSVEYAVETAVLWVVKTCYVVNAVNCTVSMAVPSTVDEVVMSLLASKTCQSVFNHVTMNGKRLCTSYTQDIAKVKVT